MKSKQQNGKEKIVSNNGNHFKSGLEKTKAYWKISMQIRKDPNLQKKNILSLFSEMKAKNLNISRISYCCLTGKSKCTEL